MGVGGNFKAKNKNMMLHENNDLHQELKIPASVTILRKIISRYCQKFYSDKFDNLDKIKFKKILKVKSYKVHSKRNR